MEMQPKAGELEEELMDPMDRLRCAEKERDKARDELKEMKQIVNEANATVTGSQRRIQELEIELERKREIETKMSLSFASQTRQLEETIISLEDSKMQVSFLHEKVKKLEGSSPRAGGEEQVSVEEELHMVKSELELTRANMVSLEEAEKQSQLKFKSLLEEMNSLRTEMKQAIKAEENSKKAMDDLALALKEVATEAKQTKEKLIATEKEAEELKEKLKDMEDKTETLLCQAKKDTDIYRNTAERLRIEAEESLLAWNAKETGFVDCIKRAEDEKTRALEENKKLLQSLTEAENLRKTAEQEDHNLRETLQQALNEASAAKEAAGIALAENSQLKDELAEKDDALVFITRENENLRINEANTVENIKELKRIFAEVTGKEFKAEKEKDPREGKKLSSTFTLNLKELIIPKHDDHKLSDKHIDSDEDDDSDSSELLRGSILYQVDSPVPPTHHRRRSSSTFIDEVLVLNPEDDDHIHIDDLENEKNPRKKKALLRRFGDIITRRRSIHIHHHTHKKEPSVGGEGNKKEVVKEPSSSGSDGQKKDSSYSGELNKKEPLVE
ncbi:hypothetical protein K2173_014900 [Erythroxylum novogranatense]|uniref:Uncharacterized protein n=1 Tax=Erythroxylum novogranatense TaxID=1862640 RepID=A0AAV8TGC1_9ROSI|nr:hypothetical protein K2173_014900 [Erythroxylum novogranatense]